MWAIKDNVSFLKKRYLFFAGIVVYGLAFMPHLLIFDRLSNLRAIENFHFFIIRILIFAGIVFSLISIGFVYVCRSVGVSNLHSCMLLLGIITNLLSVLSYWQWYSRASIIRSSLDIVLTFASVEAVAWLSLRLHRLFSRKPVNGGWS